MYLSRNAVGKLMERLCTLKGSGQSVLWAAHQVFHYLSHPEKSGILQVDVFSKVFQQLPFLPRDNTNLEASSPGKPWLSPHMGVQWCSHTSGWISAPLAVLDRTGWSRDSNSKCLLLSVLLPWNKGLSRQALLLTSLSSCATRLAGTILLRPFTVCHQFGERRCIITGARLCYTLQLLHRAWTRTRKSRHHGKTQQTALHPTKDPSIPPPQDFVKFGMDSTDAAASPRASCPVSLTHGAFKICHHKYFQLLQMMPQGTGWW